MTVGRGVRAYALPAALAALAGVLAPPGPAAAQKDTVVVVVGERYAADGLQAELLGRDYREVWTTPVALPVLDLSTFAGGLTPVERGGGQQTRSLRLLGKDGREYNFRSVDKEITQGLPPDLRESLLDDVLQDQVSSLHPAAAIVATGLLDAVGVLNPGPRLAVMPDDPRLGEFREEFAGLVGTIEVHANEADDGSWSFAGAEVDGSDDVFPALRESPDDRVDARAFLASRLMSLLMGDWDRHAGQFRWARFDTAGIHLWVPVPEDRDYAFADYDGLLVGLAGSLFPEATPFRAEYGSDLLGLTQNSAAVDRRLLTGLSWPVWERAVARLQHELDDAAIEAAVRLMPPEYFAVTGPELIRVLKARRDDLGGVARRFYLQLAAEAEIHATHAPEHASVQRLADGSVRVTVRAAPEDSAAPTAPYFERVFHPDETREIRLRMYGGDDRVDVGGTSEAGILVRVVGGEGNDVLRDSSAVGSRGPRTVFHDASGENEIATSANTVVDREEYRGPEWVPEEGPLPRDWGVSRSWFVPWVGYEGTEGVIVGGGPSFTWFGFRRLPHAGRVHVRGMYGLGSGELGVDATGSFPGVGAAPDVWLHARASGLEAFRFHGFGNATPAEEEVEGEIIRYEHRLFEARLAYQAAAGVSLSLGPVFEHVEAEPGDAVRARISAEDLAGYGKAGLGGGLLVETRPERGVLERGLRLAVDGRLFPAAWDVAEPFARLRAEVAGYAPLPGRSALAVRVGGTETWGDVPLLESATLGGSETLRGYAYQRFTGDASIHAGAELHAFLTRARLLVNGDLGVLAFSDVGRVFVDGESEGGWHVGYGAGLWMESLGRAVSLTFARGEVSRVYLRWGMPF